MGRGAENACLEFDASEPSGINFVRPVAASGHRGRTRTHSGLLGQSLSFFYCVKDDQLFNVYVLRTLHPVIVMASFRRGSV